MKKLYTVREIVELLNAELEKEGARYRYTEERVRSRLRYLRSKGVQQNEGPLVKAKILGYDRRAKYYSEEDVEKLRQIWVGPMLPEFEVGSSTSGAIDEEQDEVLVRPATIADVRQISELTATSSGSSWEEIRAQVTRMLREPGSKTFVAIADDGSNIAVGWSYAEMSPSMALALGSASGVIRVFASTDKRERSAATRALVYRAQWWLLRQKATRIIVELPQGNEDLEDLFNTMRISPDTEIRLFRADSL
jgi:hypothetical protein